MKLRANPVNTKPVLQSIEVASRSAVHGARLSRHRNLQHALAAERMRIRHICKALACAEDAGLHRRWRSAMADSLARVHEIENALCSSGTRADQTAAAAMDECLLEAMELAKANGDSRAAQTVALECMALVELYCSRIHGQAAGAFSSHDGEIRCNNQDTLGNIGDAMVETPSGCDGSPELLAGRLQHCHGSAPGFSANAGTRDEPSGKYNGYCRFASGD